MRPSNPQWRDEVARLQAGIHAYRLPCDDPRYCLDADDLARLDQVLDAILAGKSAESVGTGMLAAFGITRARGRPVDNVATVVVTLSTTSAPVLRLRDRLYTDRTLSDSYSIPLIKMLDAIAAGGTARAVGERVLALFGARRGRGRPPLRRPTVEDAMRVARWEYENWLHVVDDDELEYREVLRLFRSGMDVVAIAARLRWHVERVVAVLEPIYGRVTNPPP